MIHRLRVIASLALGAAVCLVHAGPARAAELTLGEWLQALRRDGVAILYRRELIDPATRLHGEDISLAALRTALRGRGLDLEKRGAVWTMQRMPPAAVSAAPLAAPAPLIDTVIVTGTRYRFPVRDAGAAVEQLDAGEMQTQPALAGDALRAVTRLPGVSGVGISARPHFRGGLQDEVLVTLDGLPLLEAFHLGDFQGLVSNIDDRAVASMDVYTGGFPARYGNRMSGVMDIATQQPPAEYGSELELSLYTVGAQTRGEHSASGMPRDWLVSARAGDLARITEEINARAGKPEFQDLLGRLDLAAREDAEMRLGLFLTRDDAVLRDEEESALSRIERLYLWGQWEQLLGERSSARLTASWTGGTHEKREVALGDIEPDATQSIGELEFEQDVQRLVVAGELASQLAGARLELGAELGWAEADYSSRRNFDRGLLGEVLGTGRRVRDRFNARAKGLAAGAFVAADIPLAPRWSLQPGLRADVQDYYFGASDSQWSPRVGLRFEASDALTLRLGVGRYWQPEAIHELQVLDGERSFSEPQSADQLVLGAEWQQPARRLKIETWSKRYRDPKPRYENLYNTFVLLPYTEPDRVPVRPSRGRGAGAEAEWRESLGPTLSATLRLAWLEAEDRLEDRWVARRWSQRYAVNALLAWQHEGWNVSAALAWHSGWHTSQMPEAIALDTVVPPATVLNNALMRDYLAFDLSASRSRRFADARLTVFASLSNALGRNNLAGIDYDIEADDELLHFAPSADTALPLIPLVGIRLEF